MNIDSKPLLHFYLLLGENPLLDKIWKEKYLPDLAKDMTWVDNEELPVSHDVDHCDFPLFSSWPQEWQCAYRNAEHEAHQQLKQYIASFEVHKVDKSTLYTNPDTGEVFVSYQYFNNGNLSIVEDAKKFDSPLTAAYAYKNDFNEWHEQFGKAYELLSIPTGRYTEDLKDVLEGMGSNKSQSPGLG